MRLQECVMTRALTNIPIERVEQAILLIRGEKVILDVDLAALYGVQTQPLIQVVKRNMQLSEGFHVSVDQK